MLGLAKKPHAQMPPLVFLCLTMKFTVCIINGSRVDKMRKVSQNGMLFANERCINLRYLVASVAKV